MPFQVVMADITEYKGISQFIEIFLWVVKGTNSQPDQSAGNNNNNNNNLLNSVCTSLTYEQIRSAQHIVSLSHIISWPQAL